MDQDYFTVTLSSSDMSFDDNSLALFKTSLPREIMLQGQWVVGLAELHYTKSWFNVIEDETISVFDTKGIAMASPTRLRAGWYDDGALLAAITKCLQDWSNSYKQMLQLETRGRPATRSSSRVPENQVENRPIIINPPSISFHEQSRQVELKCGNTNVDSREFYMQLSPKLNEMLGLNRRKSYYTLDRVNNESNEIEITTLDKSIKGESNGMSCYDLNYGIHSICVYSNIVSSVIVGNSYAPLLRVVPIENKKFGAQCHQIFQKPYFYPVSTNCIQVLGAELRDKSSKPIPFKFGETTVVLAFKRIQ